MFNCVHVNVTVHLVDYNCLKECNNCTTLKCSSTQYLCPIDSLLLEPVQKAGDSNILVFLEICM